MGVLEFLCDRRFHQNFVLPPNPVTDRHKPYRVSYADFGDPNSSAVVLFCGALFGTRFSYSPLDQLAKTHHVRIIHPDRPGIGGSDAVELGKRVQVWLEMVPQLLAHLNITHVSLASHSGGDIYLMNTLLLYPHFLHPEHPYVCFFAPFVHPEHSRLAHLRATELLPAPLIGKFAALAGFIVGNVIPAVGVSGALVHSAKTFILAPNPPAAIPLDPVSSEGHQDLDLDDPCVVNELRKLITTFLFAESTDGISADAQLFLKRSVSWCSPSIVWGDLDYAVQLLATIVTEDDRLVGNRVIVDCFHAETDHLVGGKGQKWFDECWVPSQSYEYRSTIVKGTDHDFLMDAAFGASEIWLQRVRETATR
ncbi:hypothetical protein EJ02DRAFT_390863 [Clathrospora elynae]|uniref:Alpha/beta-hydrolase n=1 Tax=Clathrospora elynae TaxID=706981 RepID=A0A6A5TAD6_9PLEO|nr:hypothetical protein EJ02DRAFT_390863 [Clathrospora elynae]